MPVTYPAQPLNTYTTATTGGSHNTDVMIDKVVEWVKAIEPWQTPLLDRIMTNEEFDQEVHQWGQSVRPDLDTTLAAAVADTVGTSLTVAPGTGVYFQKNAVIIVADKNTDGTPKESNIEHMLVTAVAPNTLTVERGFGDTAKTHLNGGFVIQLGIAEPQNDVHTDGIVVEGFRLFNYPQRFGAQMSADKRAQNQPTWETPGNPLLVNFTQEMARQKLLLERSAWRGVRKAGVPNPAGKRGSTFGGINSFITSNAIDNLGAVLTLNALEDILRNLWYNTDSSENKVIATSLKGAEIFDRLVTPARRIDAQGGEVNKVIRKYALRTGTFSVEVMRNIPEGNFYFLDFSYIKLRPFKGLNWHQSGKDGNAFAVDNDTKAISGDFTLEVHNEKAMARIYNFDNDLSKYTAAA